MNRERELLLMYARGSGEAAKRSYNVMYHISPEGDVVIHSAEAVSGADGMRIRFKRYDGMYTEADVSDGEVSRAIEEFLDNKNKGYETNRTVSALFV